MEGNNLEKYYKGNIVEYDKAKPCCRVRHETASAAATCVGILTPSDGRIHPHGILLRTSESYYVSVEEFSPAGVQQMTYADILTQIENEAIKGFASRVKSVKGRETYVVFKIDRDTLTRNICTHTHASVIDAARCGEFVNESFSVNRCFSLRDRRIVGLSFNGQNFESWRTVQPAEIETEREKAKQVKSAA